MNAFWTWTQVSSGENSNDNHFRDTTSTTAIAHQVGNVQFRQTMLPCSKDFARTAKLQVFLCYDESVRRVHHDFIPLSCNFGVFAAQKNTMRLQVTSSYTAPQLMKLGQAEPFAVFNDHDRSIGHVDTHFDNYGGNQNINFSACKPKHDRVFVRLLHTAVNQSDP